jgi:hypothetical protein
MNKPRVFTMNKSAKQSDTLINLSVKNPEQWPRWSGSRMRQPIQVDVDGYTYELAQIKRPRGVR